MTAEQIQENNEQIARFMGWISNAGGSPQHYRSADGWNILHISDFEYYSSWEWIMQVVEKIESVSIGETTFIIWIMRNSIEILIDRGPWSSVRKQVPGCYCTFEDTTNKLRHLHEMIVEFIKWYNQQKQ